jgi:YD repeat-containing protein
VKPNTIATTNSTSFSNDNWRAVRRFIGSGKNEGKLSRCIRHWANFSQMEAHYDWDDKGSVTVTNADGSEEVYTHDVQARLISKIDPDGAEHLKAYNDKGQLIAEKDPLGAVTEYRYDDNGLMTAVIPPEDDVPYPNAGFKGGKPGATDGHPVLNSIRIVVEANTNNIVTAFPM